MGARGPGAKPVKKPEKGITKKKSTCQPWEKKGLARADRVIAFLENLPVTTGLRAGKKMELLPFQVEFIRAVYAVDDTGKRMVRQAVLSLPRKNGKSGLVAGLGLAHFIGPESEQRGQCYSCANDRGQASILFREMKAIILATEWMSERVTIRDFTKEMEDIISNSTFAALSADVGTKHGLSPSFVAYDELSQARSRDLYEVMASAQGARKEPLLVTISTQASDDSHILSELIDYGLKIQSGELADPSFFLTLFTAPKNMDPWNEKTWLDCNPAAGVFLSLEDLKTAAMQAQRLPAKEAAFRNLRLNQRVDGESRFISAPDWTACGEPVDATALYGRPCYLGLDLSSTSDLTALVAFFPHDGGAVLPFFFVPGENIEQRSDHDRVPYRLWREQGFIEATKGRAVDKLAVAHKLAALMADYDVQGIAYDRWRVEDLKRILADEGIEAPLVLFGQGFKDMAPAVDTLEAAILERQLRHGMHPVLTWNCANCAIETDPAGNRKLSKRRSREKIDGMVALTMAAGLWSREQKIPEFDASQIMVLTG